MHMKMLMICAGILTLVACVERTMIIRSEPDQATVIVDGSPAGITPCEIPFSVYGTREVILERDRYRSLKTMVPLHPPFYQFFPLDLMTDVVIPFKIRDCHDFTFVLEPATLGPESDKASERAKELKEKLDRSNK